MPLKQRALKEEATVIGVSVIFSRFHQKENNADKAAFRRLWAVNRGDNIE
jgi:hypothetical protein